MVFSSLPIFLDPPNWNQPPQCLVGAGSGDHHQLITPAGLAPPPAGPADASAAAPASSSLPAAPRQGVSMAERARLARIPLPEPGTLRCPRCDSANTKFCYFNNYSLSQPRHFCKSCRRYWTRGGALRNVPVGGGCRRNTKRSSKSKSSRHAAAAATPSSSAPATTAADVMSLHALAHLGAPAAALDASLEGYVHMPFHQPPVLHQGLPYPFADCDDGAFSTAASAASGLLAQLAAVKMEENGGGVGVVRVHEPYWGGGGWPGEFLSGFGSSPSGNVL